MSDTAEPATTAESICALCVQTLGISSAALSIATRSGVRQLIASSDVRAADMEDLQFTLGEGPNFDAIAGGSPVLVPDIASKDECALERWPNFTDGVLAAGFHAVFAFPLHVGAFRFGALDLYRDAAGELTSLQISDALKAADSATNALLELERTMGGFDGTAVVTHHAQVHQAAGMVQVQMGLGIREALLVLRARAYSDGVAISHLAIEVVARRLRFTPEDR